MTINLIVAYCKKNNGIGYKNNIPWHLKSELKYFKEITTKKDENQSLNNIVIMGRKTWDSLPIKPLPNRTNIILSQNLSENSINEIQTKYPDTFVRRNLFSYLNEITVSDYIDNTNVFIIGGAQIYENIMDRTNIQSIDYNINIYATEIYNDFECDTFFPNINNNEHLSLTYVSEFREENGINFRHKIYKDKRSTTRDEFWQNYEEQQYMDTLKEIIIDGQENIDRTSVGTRSIFGKQYKYNLRDTFPALTTKRIFFRGIFEELMLYLTGKTDNNILNEKKIHIWDGNTTREFLDDRGLKHYPTGDMGETYGFNFRHFGANYIDCKHDYTNQGTDQLANVLHLIKNDPHSRRIIINLWNASTLKNAALPACLCMYQFYVNTKNKELNLQIYIRSSDFFLANNWNVCTGAMLVHMICNLKDIKLTPGILTVVTGDTHIYNSHNEQVIENLTRTPRPFPKLIIKEEKNTLQDYTFEDLNLIDYTPYKNISAPMAV
jgi:dihydrofolate reductase / thymidylate synthase